VSTGNDVFTFGKVTSKFLYIFASVFLAVFEVVKYDKTKEAADGYKFATFCYGGMDNYFNFFERENF
jgi:hypothetical protein